jgi:hypothetical protein
MDFETRIRQYREVRNQIKQLDEEHEAFMKDRRALLSWLGSDLLNMLNATNQDSAKTKEGTAYITTQVSATLEDAEAFRRHVIGTESWNLLDWRANKTAVKDFVAEKQEPPPGVAFNSIRTVGVRAPTKKQKEDTTDV